MLNAICHVHTNSSAPTLYFPQGNACLTTCSRVMYAFSRDGDLRISRFLRHVHPSLKAPINAVWASVTCMVVIGELTGRRGIALR